MTVQFNVDSHHTEDARFRKVLFGYDGELLEVELNELQDIIHTRFSELLDSVFGTRPLYTGTYTLASGTLTIANEVVIANRELIVLTSTSIAVANGDSVYLNIQDKTLSKTDVVKKYGDQNSGATVTNYMQDNRTTDETTRRVQVTFMLTKVNTNPGTNIKLCTINSSGAIVQQDPNSFTDSGLYKEIRRLASAQITSSGVQPNQNTFANFLVGSTTIAADLAQDTLTIVAGTAVTLTPDAANDKLTIAVNNASSAADGSLSKTDKVKLDGISSGAQPNQNAFANVTAGGSTLSATAISDTLALAAGTAVSLVGDAANRKVTINVPNATPSADGSMPAADKTKLNGVATGAEVNQNAFSNVVVGASTIASASKTDTLTLAAGTAVTLTPDTTNKKVTVAVPNATTSADGSMTGADKTKLNGIDTGAQVNQNAFTTIAVGSTNIGADTPTDTLTLVAGTAVTLTPDATNDKVTIAVANATASADGSMAKADKSKLDGIDTGATNQDNTHYVYAKLTSAVNVGSANTLYNLNVQTGSQVQFYKGVTINNITNAISITEAGKYLVTLNVTYSGADSAQFVDALIRRTLSGGTIQDVVTTQQGATGAGGNSGGWNVTQTRILDLVAGDALTFYGRSSVAPRTITDYFIDVVRISA